MTFNYFQFPHPKMLLFPFIENADRFLAHKVSLHASSSIDPMNIYEVISKYYRTNWGFCFVFFFLIAHAPNQRALDQEAQEIHLKVLKSTSFSTAANIFTLMTVIHYGNSLYWGNFNWSALNWKYYFKWIILSQTIIRNLYFTPSPKIYYITMSHGIFCHVIF